LFVSTDLSVASVDKNLGAAADALLQKIFDAPFAFSRDQWPHLRALIQSIANTKRTRKVRDRVTEPTVRAVHRDGDGNRQATLTPAAECSVRDDLGRHFLIRVRHNDDMILRSSLALNAFAASRSSRVDVLRNWSRPHETDRTHIGMIQQRIYDSL